MANLRARPGRGPQDELLAGNAASRVHTYYTSIGVGCRLYAAALMAVLLAVGALVVLALIHIDALPTALSAAMAASTATAAQGGAPASTTAVRTPVIIGGAGYAAVALAKELSLHSVKFVLYEASDYVGGRMVQKDFGTNTATGAPYRVEAGANWVQGLNGNPVWGEAIRFGLSGAAQNFDDITYYRADGTADAANARYNRGSACERQFVAYELAGDISSRCLQPSAADNPPKTVDRNFCGQYLGVPVAFEDADDLSNDALQQLAGFDPTTDAEQAEARACDVYSQDFEWAEFPNVTSGNNTLPANTYSDFRDADYWVGGDTRGYAWLVHSLAAEYLATSVNNNIEKLFVDPRLRRQRKITRVAWDPTGQTSVRVTTCRTAKVLLSEGRVHWKCVRGTDEVAEADNFVSTFSLGVLRRSLAEEAAGAPLAASIEVAPRFTPALSSVPALAHAINGYPMGYYLKVFMQFRHKFWDDTQLTVSAYSRGRWVGEFAPVWQNLDSAKFLPGSRIFFVTLTGERALDFLAQPKAVNLQDMLGALNSIFGASGDGRVQALYGHPELVAGDVLDFSYNDWVNDTLTYGMYSNMRVGRSWPAMEPSRSRFGNLMFSGEHACFRYNGYTHGALLAGRRTGRILLAERFGVAGVADAPSICDVLPYENHPDTNGYVSAPKKRPNTNSGPGNDFNPPGHRAKARGIPRTTQPSEDELDAMFASAGTTRTPPSAVAQ